MRWRPSRRAIPPPRRPAKEIDDHYKRVARLRRHRRRVRRSMCSLKADQRPAAATRQARVAAAPGSPRCAGGHDRSRYGVACRGAARSRSRWPLAAGDGDKRQLHCAAAARRRRSPSAFNARDRTGRHLHGSRWPPRYPFSPPATPEIPMDDFARLFAPGGLLDAFFNTATSTVRRHRGQDLDGAGRRRRAQRRSRRPISRSSSARAVIRDLFFAGGVTTPTVRFDIKPCRCRRRRQAGHARFRRQADDVHQ